MVSGRDPLSTFYQEEGKAYRTIQKSFWPLLEASFPLQEKLVHRGMWLPLHLPPVKEDATAYHCEVPLLPLIVYPYEWPFPLWKEAALTTLTIQQEALKEGFWLRDATPFNLTLHGGRMVHIDQLSLEPYPEGRPWPAYTEFIRSFVAPLLLMSYADRRLESLIQVYPQGLPLDLVWRLLPLRGRWSALALIHLYPHSIKKSSTVLPEKLPELPRKRLLNLIEALRVGIDSLKPCYSASPWEGYGEEACPYPPQARQKKEETVRAWISAEPCRWGLDIGAHEGGYTLFLAQEAREGAVALESDPLSIDRLWTRLGSRYSHLYPVRADLSQPPPAIGWNYTTPGLLQRFYWRFDLILALAITHHLRYRNLVPYALQMELMAQLLLVGGRLIVEFIPPTDPQVKYLHTRPEIFPDHSQEAFEAILQQNFQIERQEPLSPMQRVLYLVRKVNK